MCSAHAQSLSIVRWLEKLAMGRVAFIMECIVGQLNALRYEYSRYASISMLINITFYMLLTHWFACLWFIVGVYV